MRSDVCRKHDLWEYRFVCVVVYWLLGCYIVEIVGLGVLLAFLKFASLELGLHQPIDS